LGVKKETEKNLPKALTRPKGTTFACIL